MTSFYRIVFLLFFLFVGNGSSVTPNVPWITRENGERFLSAFLEAMSACDELQQEGIDDLESIFEALLSLIPETPRKLSVAKLQAVNMAFAAVIAEIVAIDGSGPVEQKSKLLRKSLEQAFHDTTGVVNTDLINEILSLTELFSEDNNIEQNSPEEDAPGFAFNFPEEDAPGFTFNFPEEEGPGFTFLGEYGTLNAVTSAQQSASASAAAAAAASSAAQSSSTVSTTTSTSQTYSGQEASSTSFSSAASASAASEASSIFTQFLASSLIENPGFIHQFNSIESSAAASAYASTSAEATAYSIDQGSIALAIVSAVSEATAGIPIAVGPYAFVHAFASALAQILSSYGVLNLDNVITLADQFGNSLVTAISSASVSSDVSATTGWSSAGSQIHTASGASSSGSSGASYGLSFEAQSPLLPAFGGLNDIDFLTPSPGISAVPSPGSTEFSPYSPLVSELLSSPSGLTSVPASQRIVSFIPSLVLAVTGNGFNAPLFSSTMSSLFSQISQNGGLSQSQTVIEAILEMTSALLQILCSANLGVVSISSQPATTSDIAKPIFTSIDEWFDTSNFL